MELQHGSHMQAGEPSGRDSGEPTRRPAGVSRGEHDAALRQVARLKAQVAAHKETALAREAAAVDAERAALRVELRKELWEEREATLQARAGQPTHRDCASA
jgi:hypothetical protein